MMAELDLLDREQQAAEIGVSLGTLATYVRRYRPDSTNPHYAAHPYPTYVDGQHRRFGRSVAVDRQALRDWDRARRVRPDGQTGLTAGHLRALAAIQDGNRPPASVTLSLVESGHVARVDGRGLQLTQAGQAALTTPTT